MDASRNDRLTETLRQLFHRTRPRVQHVGIEVGAIGLDQRANFWVKTRYCTRVGQRSHFLHHPTSPNRTSNSDRNPARFPLLSAWKKALKLAGDRKLN